MAKSSELESKLNELFVDKAPKLPENGKKALVQWSPWIALIVGILTLLAAVSLWHWAHLANSAINYANQICATYQGVYGPTDCGISASRLTFWVWLALIVTAVEGVLYLLAFPGLRDRKKQGWNYLYYGALVNVVYAVVSLFTSYNAVGNFIGALIGSAIGFYLLFQIRSHYLGTGSKAPKAPTEK